MGLLVADSKTFPNGLTLTNFVISLKGNIIEINKITAYDQNQNMVYIWDVSYRMFYYADQTAYTTKKEPIYQERGNLNLTESQLDSNIYTLIFNNLKANYTTTTSI